MAKSAKLTFDEPQPELKPVDLEFLTKRIEVLTSLLSRLVVVTGERTANGTSAKDRCYDCARSNSHASATNPCPCVCHEVRKYLTELALER